MVDALIVGGIIIFICCCFCLFCLVLGGGGGALVISNPRLTGQKIQEDPLEVGTNSSVIKFSTNPPAPATMAYTMTMDIFVEKAGDPAKNQGWREIMANYGPETFARKPWVNIAPGTSLTLETGHATNIAGVNPAISFTNVNMSYGKWFTLTWTVNTILFTVYVNGAKVGSRPYSTSDGIPNWPSTFNWHWNNVPAGNNGSVKVANVYFWPSLLPEDTISNLKPLAK